MKRTRDPSRPTPAPRPSPHVVGILRRAATGFILVTHTTDDKERPVTRYCYDDGTAIRNAKGAPIAPREINRMASAGWLIPVKGELLPLGAETGPPQRYRARTVADGTLPRFC